MDQPQNQPPQNTGQGVPQPPPPFSCTYAPNVPELLQQMNISLAISTYQAGKVILISPKNRDELVQLPRNFQKPMGIAVKDNKMAIASLDEVIILANSPGLAKDYPAQPGVYDSFYIPRNTYYTSAVDLHDLVWGNEGLWAVNTLYSTLCLVTDNYSFEPRWKPDFISKLLPEDRCHLNGLALENGAPRFVTALGKTDNPQGWRETKASGGVLVDTVSNEIILENLPMPHTPRIYHNELYILLSGTGELAKVNVKNKTYDVLKAINGFARGMDIFGDYLFIGLSKLRTTSKAFQDLPISQKSVFPGIIIIYLPTMSTVGFIKYETSVDEIFDVKVLENTVRPGILNTLKPIFKQAITTPEQSIWSVSPERPNNTGV